MTLALLAVTGDPDADALLNNDPLALCWQDAGPADAVTKDNAERPCVPPQVRVR